MAQLSSSDSVFVEFLLATWEHLDKTRRQSMDRISLKL